MNPSGTAAMPGPFPTQGAFVPGQIYVPPGGSTGGAFQPPQQFHPDQLYQPTATGGQQPGVQPEYSPQPGYNQPAPIQQQPKPQPNQPSGYTFRPLDSIDGETKQVASLQTGQLLASLTPTDTVLIKQTTDVLQVLTGVRHHNRYKIKIPGIPGEGENGGPGPNKEILFAAEESGWLSRICLHSIRPFDMKIFDPFQNEVIHLKRKLRCLPICCIPKMGQVLTVESPPGYLIGKIEQTTAFFGTEFLIKDQDDEAQLVLRAPVCRTGLLPGSSIEFKVCKIDSDEEVGRISKEWGGVLREFFTDSDFFGISYPKELDIRLKAILLGATFLIDALFFDTSGREVHRAGPLSV